MTDIFILIVILLLNSKILERLRRLAITKDEITLTLQEIKQRQDKQKDNIEINSKNIKANRDILKRLSSLEQEIVGSKSSKQLVSSNLVEPNELQHLYKLVNNEPFIYHKQCFFEQELRQLRTLGFLETKPGIQIHSLPESET